MPVPAWTKQATDVWVEAAGIESGWLFRPVNRAGQVRGDQLSEKVVWQMLKPYVASMGKRLMSLLRARPLRPNKGLAAQKARFTGLFEDDRVCQVVRAS
jgi:hypothetical protein